MRTSITLGFLSKGRAIRPNRQLNVTNDHPDLSDLVDVKDLIAAATAIYAAVKGDWKVAAAGALPILKKAYSGKEVLVQKTAHETFQQGGRIILPGGANIIDERRVVFRAESEDDLTTSFGRADQAVSKHPAKIKDNGEVKTTNVYSRRFAIPPQSVPPGDYIFNFGSGDDGFIFDLGVSSILTVTVAPPFSHGDQGPVGD